MIRLTKPIGTMRVTVEGKDSEALYEELSDLSKIQEILTEAANGCQRCESKNIKFHKRESKEGFTFRELHCSNPGCFAKLRIGERKDHTFYPKRWEMDKEKFVLDEQGKKIPSGKNGWFKTKENENSGEWEEY